MLFRSYEAHRPDRFDVNSIRASNKSLDEETSSLNAYNPEYGNFEAPDLSSLNPDINPETKKFKYYGITLQDQIKITDAISASAALRYDKVEQQLTTAVPPKNAQQPRPRNEWKN